MSKISLVEKHFQVVIPLELGQVLPLAQMETAKDRLVEQGWG